MQETLRVARDYAALGWHVVPVTPGQKMPAVKWADYCDRPATEDQLSNWFSVGGFGIGLVQGKTAGTITLDFDGEDGQDSLRQLERLHGELPETPRQITPGGGLHYVFRHPGGYVPTRKGLMPGFDVRGDGGFIVSYPSRHPNGRRYEWDVDAHYEDVNAAECPEWLAELVRGPAPDNADAIVHEVRRGPLGISEAVVVDGREQYMRDTVLAVLRDLRDALGRLPTCDELFERSWPQYASKVDLKRPGRGADEVRRKCEYTLHRVASGRVALSPMPVVPVVPELSRPDEQPKAETVRRKILSIDELEALPPPTWLVEGLIPEKGFVVPYGPPKAGKTFIVLSLALHIAAGKDWFGHKVCGGGVVYIAGEGVGGFALRIKAMRAHYKIGKDIPFWVIPSAIPFQSEAEVQAIPDLVRSVADDEPISLVVIDTLSRAMPGVEENSAKELGLVIANIDWLREKMGCTVAPVHHTGKDVERGLRGSMALAGALDASFLITKPEKGQARMVNDNQKDADEAPTIEFDMIEVMPPGSLRGSLVPVLAEDQTVEPDHAPMWREVARALGVGGQLTLNKVGQALGYSAHKRQDMANSLPFYPDYVEFHLTPGEAIRLMKTRVGAHANSPINVVRSEVR